MSHVLCHITYVSPTSKLLRLKGSSVPIWIGITVIPSSSGGIVGHLNGKCLIDRVRPYLYCITALIIISGGMSSTNS